MALHLCREFVVHPRWLRRQQFESKHLSRLKPNADINHFRNAQPGGRLPSIRLLAPNAAEGQMIVSKNETQASDLRFPRVGQHWILPPNNGISIATAEVERTSRLLASRGKLNPAKIRPIPEPRAVESGPGRVLRRLVRVFQLFPGFWMLCRGRALGPTQSSSLAFFARTLNLGTRHLESRLTAFPGLPR